MRLRAIELQGFKSFADRTRLTFDDGITAVVGPNGSGKSNISDAVKWVFGEQSSKSLRGTKMEDVIFGGTKNRPPMGYAWVSLFIDNADRSIDVDSDEVVITRKLYRTGESEYRINGSPVRLKDISGIFMDTGLGRDGYSVIEQGKISDIVGAKSTQRREIFEEAAGISRFRYRKGEAERRLAQAEENLVRLRDILGELEGRVEPLRLQSEKARKFLALSEEKKTLELSIWTVTLEKLRGELHAQEDKLLLCKNDRQAVQSRLDGIEEELSACEAEIAACAVFIDARRQEIKEAEAAAASAQVDIAVKKNDILHNTQRVQELEDRLRDSAGDREELDRRIGEARRQGEEHRRALAGEEETIAALRARQEENRARQEVLAGKARSLALQREELQEGAEKARLSSQTAATLVEETVSRLDALREQLTQKDQRLARLREEEAECRRFAGELEEKLESLLNTKNGYLYKQQGRREKLDRLEEEQQGLERSAGERLQRAQLLADMEKHREGFQNSVKAVMKHAAAGSLRGVVGPVSDLVRAGKEYAVAVEVAMGPAMQHIVVEDEGVAKRAIRLLVETKAGRCTFLPLTTVRGRVLEEQGLEDCPGCLGVASRLVECGERYRGIVESILGRTAVAEDLDSAAAIAKKYGHRFRVVTLDGQVVNPGGSMTGGYLGKSAGILSRKNEIDALRAEARELTARGEKLEGELESLRRELASMDAMVAGVEAEEKTASDDLVAANAELRRLTLSLREAEELGEQSLREFDALTARVEELKGQGLSAGELAESLAASLEELSGELRESAGAQEAASREAEEIAAALSERQIAYAAAAKDQEAMDLALETLVQDREGSEARLLELREEIRKLGEENRALEAEAEEIAARAQGSREKAEALAGEIRARSGDREKCEARVTALRREEREENSRREALSGELARLEERYAAMTAEGDSIAAKMWDEYEMTKSEAAAAAVPLEDLPSAQRRLAELRNRVRNLGSVNVAAIEEYKEVSERYEFLRGQVGDAESSKKELEGLITQLSSEMSRIFLEKFDAINRHFGAIFTELFGGGRGELRLTDPADPLETGIDIFVQPAGKMVGLSLLSGGEKAIVAICLYFAILKVNPAPFVLLDEIEAALDEVNVARFAAYLRRMTDRTQFIAITHRRGTMEEADVLYGVTMEEEGVSKLLRLDVAELETRLKLQPT